MTRLSADGVDRIYYVHFFPIEQGETADRLCKTKAERSSWRTNPLTCVLCPSLHQPVKIWHRTLLLSDHPTFHGYLTYYVQSELQAVLTAPPTSRGVSISQFPLGAVCLESWLCMFLYSCSSSLPTCSDLHFQCLEGNTPVQRSPQSPRGHHYPHQPGQNALGVRPQIADRIARRYYHIDPQQWAVQTADRHKQL